MSPRALSRQRLPINSLKHFVLSAFSCYVCSHDETSRWMNLPAQAPRGPGRTRSGSVSSLEKNISSQLLSVSQGDLKQACFINIQHPLSRLFKLIMSISAPTGPAYGRQEVWGWQDVPGRKPGWFKEDFQEFFFFRAKKEPGHCRLPHSAGFSLRRREAQSARTSRTRDCLTCDPPA